MLGTAVVTVGALLSPASAATAPSAEPWHRAGPIHYPRTPNNTGDHGVWVYEEVQGIGGDNVRWCVSNHHSAGAVINAGVIYVTYVLDHRTTHNATFPAHGHRSCFPEGGYVVNSTRELHIEAFYNLIDHPDYYEIHCINGSGCTRQ